MTDKLLELAENYIRGQLEDAIRAAHTIRVGEDVRIYRDLLDLQETKQLTTWMFKEDQA